MSEFDNFNWRSLTKWQTNHKILFHLEIIHVCLNSEFYDIQVILRNAFKSQIVPLKLAISKSSSGQYQWATVFYSQEVWGPLLQHCLSQSPTHAVLVLPKMRPEIIHIIWFTKKVNILFFINISMIEAICNKKFLKWKKTQ